MLKGKDALAATAPERIVVLNEGSVVTVRTISVLVDHLAETMTKIKVVGESRVATMSKIRVPKERLVRTRMKIRGLGENLDGIVLKERKIGIVGIRMSHPVMIAAKRRLHLEFQISVMADQSRRTALCRALVRRIDLEDRVGIARVARPWIH